MVKKLSEMLKQAEFRKQVYDSVNKKDDKLPHRVKWRDSYYQNKEKILLAVEKHYKELSSKIIRDSYDWKHKPIFSFKFVIHYNEDHIVDDIVLFFDKKQKYYMIVYSLKLQLDLKNFNLETILEDIKKDFENKHEMEKENDKKNNKT